MEMKKKKKNVNHFILVQKFTKDKMGQRFSPLFEGWNRALDFSAQSGHTIRTYYTRNGYNLEESNFLYLSCSDLLVRIDEHTVLIEVIGKIADMLGEHSILISPCLLSEKKEAAFSKAISLVFSNIALQDSSLQYKHDIQLLPCKIQRQKSFLLTLSFAKTTYTRIRLTRPAVRLCDVYRVLVLPTLYDKGERIIKRKRLADFDRSRLHLLSVPHVPPPLAELLDLPLHVLFLDLESKRQLQFSYAEEMTETSDEPPPKRPRIAVKM